MSKVLVVSRKNGPTHHLIFAIKRGCVMKKTHISYKLVSIFLICMLLAVAAGNVYAGRPPVFRSPDAEHIQESEQTESPTAFIQLERHMPFAPSRWKRDGHHHSQESQARASDTSEDAETRKNLGRMFGILSMQFRQLVPVPRHHVTMQLAQSGVVDIPEETISINHKLFLCTETSDDVAVAANHHLHQFQILLI
jgi:hypothetical protein